MDLATHENFLMMKIFQITVCKCTYHQELLLIFDMVCAFACRYGYDSWVEIKLLSEAYLC